MRDFVQQTNALQARRESQKKEGKVPRRTSLTTTNNPSLFEEMTAMSELSAMIYTVAYLLDVVGKGGYPDPNAPRSWNPFRSTPKKQLKRTDLILETPEEGAHHDDSPSTTMGNVRKNLPAADVLKFIELNEEALSQDSEITGETTENGEVSPQVELLRNALDEIRSRQNGGFLWAFDHHFGGGNGLVYGISVCRTLKRVTVVFRGSSTGQDWLQNGQVKMANLQTTKVLEELKFEDTMKVHGGFKRYLFDDGIEQLNLTDQQMDETKPGKYGQILRDLEACYNHEEKGVKVHEGFMLFVAGHSLGGALSTLLATKLACSNFVRKRIPTVPMPIVNISVASPYVGDQGFKKASQLLEENGRLRHIRVSNEQDIVTVSPPPRFLWGAIYEPYVHTGINVHLRPGKGKHDIDRNLVRTFSSQVTWPSDNLERHTVVDYWGRQNEDRETFQKLTIEQLYKMHPV